MRLLLVGDQRRKRGKPARGDLGARRDAVIGQTVPAGQRQHRNVGRDEAQHLFEIGNALAVGEHIGERTGCSGEIGENQRLGARGHGADGHRPAGGGDAFRGKTGNHALASLKSGEKSGR
jgi:hypothetical protein